MFSDEKSKEPSCDTAAERGHSQQYRHQHCASIRWERLLGSSDQQSTKGAGKAMNTVYPWICKLTSAARSEILLYAGLCGRCTGVAVPLRVVPSPTGLPSTLRRGKIEGRRRRGRQKMRWLDSITDSMDVHNSL